MSDQSSNRPLAGKAVTYKALGGPEVIEIVERTVRAPAAGEVRIEVKAAAVNPTDILFCDPGFGDQFGGDTFPIVPGMDAAGIIESVGPGVSRLHAGEKVMAAVMPVRPEGGAQAQHIVVPAASVVPIPEGVSLAEASTLPTTGLTALNALEIAALKTGQILAVSGGAGLLAQYAIAAAKRRGNKGYRRRQASRYRAGTRLRREYRGRARTRLRQGDPPGSCPMVPTRCSTRRSLGKSPLAPSVTGASTFRFAAGEASPPNGGSRSSRCLCPMSSNVPNGSNCSATWSQLGR